MPGFAAKQIASWLYDKKVATIDEMTNLSLKHREALKADYEVGGEAPTMPCIRSMALLNIFIG